MGTVAVSMPSFFLMVSVSRDKHVNDNERSPRCCCLVSEHRRLNVEPRRIKCVKVIESAAGNDPAVLPLLLLLYNAETAATAATICRSVARYSALGNVR